MSWHLFKRLMEISKDIELKNLKYSHIANNISSKELIKLEESINEKVEIENGKESPKMNLRDLENMMAARGGRVHIIKKEK